MFNLLVILKLTIQLEQNDDFLFISIIWYNLLC